MDEYAQFIIKKARRGEELERENDKIKNLLNDIEIEYEHLEKSSEQSWNELNERTQYYKTTIEEILEDGGNTEHTAELCIEALKNENPEGKST